MPRDLWKYWEGEAVRRAVVTQLTRFVGQEEANRLANVRRSRGRRTLKEELQRVAPRDLRVPSGYRTVQAAVIAAKSGDRIAVAPGTHKGGIQVESGKQVVVWGEGTCGGVGGHSYVISIYCP